MTQRKSPDRARVGAVGEGNNDNGRQHNPVARQPASPRAKPYEARLRSLVRNAIERHLPAEQLAVLKAAEELERAGLEAWAASRFIAAPSAARASLWRVCPFASSRSGRSTPVVTPGTGLCWACARRAPLGQPSCGQLCWPRLTSEFRHLVGINYERRP
jgi:hypothetical protein